MRTLYNNHCKKLVLHHRRAGSPEAPILRGSRNLGYYISIPVKSGCKISPSVVIWAIASGVISPSITGTGLLDTRAASTPLSIMPTRSQRHGDLCDNRTTPVNGQAIYVGFLSSRAEAFELIFHVEKEARRNLMAILSSESPSLYPSRSTRALVTTMQPYSFLAGLKGSLTNGLFCNLSATAARNSCCRRASRTSTPSLSRDSTRQYSDLAFAA